MTSARVKAGLLSPKQDEVLNFYLHNNFKILILVGAVRAGKTHIDNWIFLHELRRVQKLAEQRHDSHPMFILAGATDGAIKNNVISEMERQFPDLVMKQDRNGHYHLYGIDIVPVYTSQKNGIKRARGFTSYGAYINEASLCARNIFDEIQNRCSVTGSHIICDTNPDVPTHWLKTDYIDNHDPRAGIKSFTFTIDDNTFLAKDYVSALKASKPRGVFYDRDILGKWSTGAGIVYSDFDQKTMVIPDDQVPSGLDYYAGVDWGFVKGHENVIEVWGDDDNGTSYLLDVKIGTGQYIDHWIEVAKDLANKYDDGMPFYCDSARPEYVDAFYNAGLNSSNADKKVMDGIEFCSQLIKQGKVKVAKSASQAFLDDIYQYQWDENKGVPVKAHDNTMDSMRYALFTHHNREYSEAIPNFLI